MSLRPSGEEIQRSKTKDLIHPTDFYVVENLGPNFSRAISEIQVEVEIGLALSGVNLGREGRLCWVQIATRSSVFLFDVVALGEGVFENGTMARALLS